jgi:hypothetical protein
MSESELLERERQNIGTAGGGMGDLDEAMDALDVSGEGDPIEDDDDEELVVPDMDTTQVIDPPRARVQRYGGSESEDEPTPRGRHRRPATRRSPFAEQVSEDFADILAGINFEPGQHKISVYRMEPEFDTDTGRRITGLCETFRRPVGLDEIQKKFGGGTYKILVTGPREDTGKGSQLKANKMVDIVGDPIIPTSVTQKRKEEERARQEQDSQLDRIMDRADRREAEAKKEIREMNNTVLQLVAKMADRPAEDPNAAATAAMTPILTMMKADSDRRDREAKEQRERDEARRREEADRRREEQAAADRRHEAEMKRQDQQFQLQLEQMKSQQEMQRQQMTLEAANGKQSMEMMLSFMQRTDSEKESRAKEQTQLQMQVMTQMSEMQRASLESQLKIYADQLKDAKSKGDPFLDTLAKFQQVQELLNPGEPEKDTWEKIADRLGEAAPAVVTGLSALRSQPQQPPQMQQLQLMPQPGQQMLPGSVAVVENIDQIQGEVALGTPVQGHQSQMGGVEHAPQQHGGPQFVEVDKEARKLEPMDGVAPQAAPQEDDSIMYNDFVEFMAYPNDASNEEVLTMLVKNLDLAMQRGLDEDAMYEKCLATLPAAPRGFLKMLPAATLLAFVENNVPEQWALRSIDGDVKLRAVHEKLVTAG